jgi:hypothetical protein
VAESSGLNAEPRQPIAKKRRRSQDAAPSVGL